MKYNFNNLTKLRVRYGETDQMGYCYYGNYAMYFEVGRVEAMRSLGMSYRSLEERGIMLPVSHFEVNYKSPARYDDELSIKTSITEVKGARLRFDYIIELEDGTRVSNATTTLVFISKETMRPISPPTDFLDLLTPYYIED
jgi:acyl-CoA thioester hydrolase